MALTTAATMPVITMPPTVWAMAPTAIVASLPPGIPVEASETIADAAITPEQVVVVSPVLTAIVVAALVILSNEYGVISC